MLLPAPLPPRCRRTALLVLRHIVVDLDVDGMALGGDGLEEARRGHEHQDDEVDAKGDALIGTHDDREVTVRAVLLLRLLDEGLLLDGLVLEVQRAVLLERDEVGHVHLRLGTGGLQHIEIKYHYNGYSKGPAKR